MAMDTYFDVPEKCLLFLMISVVPKEIQIFDYNKKYVNEPKIFVEHFNS